VFRWPLLAIAALALIVIIERTVVLAGRTMGLGKGIRQVLALVKSGRVGAAETACARMRGPEGKILREALASRDEEKEVLEGEVRAVLLDCAPLFQARLSFIALCGTVAPLVGLLGTVAGLFTAFRLASALGGGDPRAISGGLSESLAALELGLVIAVPCLVAKGLLSALADWGQGKLEAGAFATVIALRKERRESVGVEEPVS
jgi:biopolymer transport protein ExbB